MAKETGIQTAQQKSVFDVPSLEELTRADRRVLTHYERTHDPVAIQQLAGYVTEAGVHPETLMQFVRRGIPVEIILAELRSQTS